MQAGGIELVVPERIEAGICYESQGKGDGDDDKIDGADFAECFVCPPEADHHQQEGQYQEIECCGKVECHTVTDDIPDVANAERMSLATAEHEYHLCDDKHYHRPQIDST